MQHFGSSIIGRVQTSESCFKIDLYQLSNTFCLKVTIISFPPPYTIVSFMYFSTYLQHAQSPWSLLS